MSSPSSSKPSLPVLLYGIQTGPKHLRKGSPCQDAFVGQVDDHFCVFVFSDGHGSSKYAEEGAALAVHLVHEGLVEVAAWLKRGAWDKDTLSSIHAKLVNLLQVWRQRVDMIAAARNEVCSYRDYGCTLGFSLATEGAVLVGQLGDGDILKVNHNGSLSYVLPSDSELFGDETTSLCSPHPETHLRLILTPPASPGYLLFMATDGYSKAYEANDFYSVPTGYQNLLKEHSLEEVQSALPDFLQHVSIGSGDDTTLGLFYWPTHTEVHSLTQVPFLVASELPSSWRNEHLWEVAPRDCFRQHAPFIDDFYGTPYDFNSSKGFGAESVDPILFYPEEIHEQNHEDIDGMRDGIAHDETITISKKLGDTRSDVGSTRGANRINRKSDKLSKSDKQRQKLQKQREKRQEKKANIESNKPTYHFRVIHPKGSKFGLQDCRYIGRQRRYVPGLKRVNLVVYEHKGGAHLVGYVKNGRYQDYWIELFLNPPPY